MADCGDCKWAGWGYNADNAYTGESPWEVDGCHAPSEFGELQAYVDGNGTDFNADDPDQMECPAYIDLHGEELE